jgi:hypothetical protein
MDREKGRAPTGAKKPGARSQHGELWAQSTQHIGVHHRVEGGRPERKMAGA